MGNLCKQHPSLFTESDMQIERKFEKQTIPKINQFTPKHLKLGYLVEGKDEAVVKLQGKSVVLSPLDLKQTLIILKKHNLVSEISQIQVLSGESSSVSLNEFSSKSFELGSNSRLSFQNQSQLSLQQGKVCKPSSFRNIHLSQKGQ